MNILIEIISGYELPKSRSVGQGDKQRTVHNQDAFIHLGGPFPTKFSLPLESPTQMYQVGKYSLSPESFRIGQYGDLEINRFDIRLIPFEQKKVS